MQQKKTGWLQSWFGVQDMTVGRPMDSLVRFSIPLLVGNLAQQLYNTVDSIVVGQYIGDTALAAVGTAGPILNLLLVLFMGIATGASILSAQYFGAHDREPLSRVVGASILLTVISGLFMTFVGYSLSPWLMSLVSPPPDVLEGAVIYLQIIFIGILVSYVLVRKKGKVASLIDTLIMFPYVIPGSVLGIGLIVAFNRKPVVLVGTAAIMIISYVIRKLPYTVRSGSAFLYQMDPFIEEASINLGVSPMKTFFTVTARMMLPGIMSGAVLSWITCINELSSSIMLYSGKTSTIAVAIYQEVVRMSDGTAAALATILTLTTIVSLVIVFRATKGKVKIV